MLIRWSDINSNNSNCIVQTPGAFFFIIFAFKSLTITILGYKIYFRLVFIKKNLLARDFKNSEVLYGISKLGPYFHQKGNKNRFF